MSRPRFLVTGANGFLGTHVLAALQALDIPVWALGRNAPQSVRPEQWLPLEDPGDAPAMQLALEKAQPEVIVHLAGAAVGPLPELYRVNAIYGATLLAAASKVVPAARVVLAGSAAEYGPVEADALPVTEETPHRPRDGYGITKLAQTHHALASLERGQNLVVARLFNFVGPHMPGHLALGAFGRQVAAMPPEGGVLRTGDLSTERDFLSVHAVTQVLLALAKRQDVTGVLNVCSGVPTRLRSLVDELVRQCPFPVEVQEDPGRAGVTSVRRHYGSAERLKSHGIEPPAFDLRTVMAELAVSVRPQRPAP
ncbi:NAD-dependent epimerase/dehydratase family protein [Sabulicella glaciei]|uniref:NAD(P)-dependent oxidoreductase n=1 Tax=Sabulicella glaciei TaxID=2984948 RepID=A0ABT3NZB4_9PROT|nr:NAD(P)-dependent oxidoreductase [Roseococcus sp. MDT2-1-1]MCW8087507.1 NAD(P)-dependent oxidoreductase [Roseococcus sp. MDT2-1-1]